MSKVSRRCESLSKSLLKYILLSGHRRCFKGIFHRSSPGFKSQLYSVERKKDLRKEQKIEAWKKTIINQKSFLNGLLKKIMPGADIIYTLKIRIDKKR